MSVLLNLLLVEDSPDDAEFTVRELKKHGYDLSWRRVESFEDMNAAIDEKTWDIVIADYSMPTFSGLGALKLIQEKQLDVPFILVSGTMGEDIAVGAMKAGAHDYVLKEKLWRLGPAVDRELREAEVRKQRQQTEEDRDRLLHELQDAVRVRDEFLSIASHELRTPLTPLRLHIENLLYKLREDPKSVSYERLVANLEVAENRVLRLSEMIETLLDISRITAGRLDLAYEEFNLTDLMNQVLKRFRPDIEKAGCKLTIKFDEAVIGTWDKLRLEQVITNLLSNSLKYGANKPLEIHVRGDKYTAWIVIKDYGIGIAAEDRQRIFERFERAVPSKHYGGFGLGLWIIGQIVDAHSGKIDVQSQPGEGACFTVELPKAKSGSTL